jgi:hypothetical protein
VEDLLFFVLNGNAELAMSLYMLCLLNNKLHKIIVSFFAAIFLVIPVQAISPKYLSVVADLPLPSGLVEEIESSLSFNKLEGSIVEFKARGKLSKNAAVSFYNTTLPRLGWGKYNTEGSLFSWLRSGEVLQIVFVEEINILIARFSITPR